MPRGSAISGRLVDEFGDPIADASRQRDAIGLGGRPSPSSADGTHRADQRPRAVPDLRVVAGRLLRECDVPRRRHDGDGDRDVAWPWAALRRGGPDRIEPEFGLRADVFPRHANGAEAQRITLAVGQEAQNTDFALLPVKLAKITGTVISSEGKPVEGSMINAVPRNADGAGMMMAGQRAQRQERQFHASPTSRPANTRFSRARCRS